MVPSESTGTDVMDEDTTVVVIPNDSDTANDNNDDSEEAAVPGNTAENVASLLARLHLEGITEEDMKRPVSKSECTKLVLTVSKETAMYCCLSMGVGGQSDCLTLREELKNVGSRVFEHIMLCKKRLMPSLLRCSKRLKEEERLDLERLYRIFSGCLEMLQAEFIRTMTLQTLFPLWDTSTCLIQTGITDCMAKKTVASILAEQMAANRTQRKTSDLEELKNLERRVTSLQELNYCTSQIMDVKPWDYKPDPDLTKIEVETSEVNTAQPQSIMTNRMSRHRKCIIVTIVLGSLLLIAAILGLALALPKQDSSDNPQD